MKSSASLIVSLILSAFLVSAHADDKTSAPSYSQPAMDVSGGGVVMPNRDELRNPPITVECWARLHDAATYNILVASDPKTSSQHWELYTLPNLGTLCVFLPGMGLDFGTNGSICDDAWHYLAMILEKDQVRLYVDGKLVKRQASGAADPRVTGPDPGSIAIGQSIEGNNGCNGLIQAVRISKGVREITAMPSGPFTKDATTLELWPATKAPDTVPGVKKP